jgi:Phycobilisome protein
MSNISQIVIKSTTNEDTKRLVDRAIEILNISQILITNTNSIVKDSLEAAIQDISLYDEETDLKKLLIVPELWMPEVSRDCKEILRYITYALIAKDELVLNDLNLENKYLALGVPIRFISKVVRKMHTLSTSLVNNSDITEDLDVYFKYMIDRLDIQDRLALLNKQHQSLTKLKQEWLAGDADEQTETWNYLRDALNPDSPSYSPVSV